MYGNEITDFHRKTLYQMASELFPSSMPSLWASTSSPSCLQEHQVSTMFTHSTPMLLLTLAYCTALTQQLLKSLEQDDV